ncbi:MAG: hypothetical protein V4556_05500 [Bacteroidota bacterium]
MKTQNTNNSNYNSFPEDVELNDTDQADEIEITEEELHEIEDEYEVLSHISIPF